MEAVERRHADGAGEPEQAQPGRAVAALALLGTVVGLACLPAAVVIGALPPQTDQLALVLGSLAALGFATKLAAMAWGVVSRFAPRPPVMNLASPAD